MYPLLLKPPVMDYLWGGTRLKEEFNIITDKNPAAEAWCLSEREDNCCVVVNGEYSGETLHTVLERWGNTAIGKNAAAFPYFPLLIKLIDAKAQLSVQVHPDDAYALKNEGEFGKTEMWYVIDAVPGARLLYGFSRDISREEFERRIRENTLIDVCNSVPVKSGDLFFIPSGMLHSIGEGILVAEVQQNSNTTYRIYDFDRVGADGKKRALHIDKALDVTTLTKQSICLENKGFTAIEGGGVRELAACDYFSARLVRVDSEVELYNEDSFISLVCLNGECKIGDISLQKGSSVFVPAGCRVKPVGCATLLESYI